NRQEPINHFNHDGTSGINQSRCWERNVNRVLPHSRGQGRRPAGGPVYPNCKRSETEAYADRIEKALPLRYTLVYHFGETGSLGNPAPRQSSRCPERYELQFEDFALFDRTKLPRKHVRDQEMDKHQENHQDKVNDVRVCESFHIPRLRTNTAGAVPY